MIAARSAGFAPEVTYDDRMDFIHVGLDSDTPLPSPLFDAIPLRQNTRSEHDGRLVKNADLDRLQALHLESGVSLRFFPTNPVDMETALEYVNQGNLAQYEDQAFLEELIDWLRFNKKEALATLDGLFSDCSWNPAGAALAGAIIRFGNKTPAAG